MLKKISALLLVWRDSFLPAAIELFGNRGFQTVSTQNAPHFADLAGGRSRLSNKSNNLGCIDK
jgi:hypothetical protein